MTDSVQTPATDNARAMSQPAAGGGARRRSMIVAAIGSLLTLAAVGLVLENADLRTPSPSHSMLSSIIIPLVFVSVGLLITAIAWACARTGALQPAQSGGIAGGFKMPLAAARKIPNRPPNKAIE